MRVRARASARVCAHKLSGCLASETSRAADEYLKRGGGEREQPSFIDVGGGKDE